MDGDISNTTTGAQAADQMQQAADSNQQQYTPPADPSDQSAPAPSSQPAPPPPQQAAPPPPPPSGVGSILHSIGDFLDGRTTTPGTAIDANGNRTTTPGTPKTTGQQFANIGLEALTGAARGAAAPPGPGHVSQGFAAGTLGQVQQMQQDQKDADAQAQADFQNKAAAKMQNLNYQILTRKMASDTLEDALKARKGTQDQVEFAQRQEDREKLLGSTDMGFVKNLGELADMGNSDPQFIKNLHGGLINPVPEYDAEGNTVGMHVWLRKPDANDQPLPDGGQIHVYTPPAKPGDKPTYALYTPHNMTVGQAHNADMKAAGDYQAWVKAQDEHTTSVAGVGEKRAVTTKDYAEANKTNAETTQLENSNTGDFSQDAGFNTVAQKLATGDMTLDEVPKRTGKGQPQVKDYIAAADDYSKKNLGMGYQPAIVDQEKKFAQQPKTQAYLEGIDRMTGAHGMPGQLDQLKSLAQQAGVGPNAPINEIKLAVKNRLGNTAAKNFESLLSETQTNLGTLIGNPLIGSGESDKKLQTAKEAFGSNVTLDNLNGQVDTVKDVLNRSRNYMGANNRFIRMRYGQQQQPAQTAPAAPNTSQAARAPGAPAPQAPAAGKVTLIPGEQTAGNGTLVVRGGQWVPISK